MNYYKLLTKLCETPGPSGNEQRIADVIAELWEPLTDEIIRDRIGSLIGIKHGRGDQPRPRLMLAAHMDEIGLMVTQLKENNGCGFLKVINVGGVDIRHLYAQTVTIHGRRDIPGVLAALPARMLPADRQNKPFGYEDLVIDPALPFEEVEELVEVGDFVTFRQPVRKLLGKTVTGKALDNRASVAAVTDCLERLGDRSHDWDVIAVATAQEETRLLGAYTSAFAQFPEAAIAIDVTFAKGAGTSDAGAVELDSGPALDIGPNVHPGMFKALNDAAGALEMDVSTITHTRGSGTDAFGLQVARSGVPTGLVSIPLRYMHTMVETINTNDIKRCGRLLSEFIVNLDGRFLENIAEQMMGVD